MESLDDRDVELSDALLARLPMFPLPRAALFPGIVLPLHLFEARYRALAEYCVRGPGQRTMALAALVPGHEADYHARPPVYPVMGVGRVVAEQELPDGRWNIALRGIGRVEMLEELAPDQPFRLIRARRVRDVGATDDRATAERLSHIILQVARSVPAVRPQLSALLREAASPGRVADVVAGLFVEDFAERRRLLEEPRISERLAALSEVAATMLLEASLMHDEGTELN